MCRKPSRRRISTRCGCGMFYILMREVVPFVLRQRLPVDTDQTKSCLHRAYRYRTVGGHMHVYVCERVSQLFIVHSVSSPFRSHCERAVQEGSRYYAHWHFSEQQCLPQLSPKLDYKSHCSALYARLHAAMEIEQQQQQHRQQSRSSYAAERNPRHPPRSNGPCCTIQLLR